MLAYHDRRLKMVANAFANRLRGTKIPDEVAATEGVTGKGLDIIIDEVKERTGASPFIHGKHSSLDPFSIIDTLPDGTPADPNAPWVDYTTNNTNPASSHYIPSTFTQGQEVEASEEGGQMQYYLSNMEFGGGELQTSPNLSGSPDATYASPNPPSATVAPSAASPPTPQPASKRGRPGGGIRAKRGSKAAISGGSGTKG